MNNSNIVVMGNNPKNIKKMLRRWNKDVAGEDEEVIWNVNVLIEKVLYKVFYCG